VILAKANNESFLGFESRNSSMKRNAFGGKINLDVDFNPERLDGVFGMAAKTIRKSIRIRFESTEAGVISLYQRFAE
jgi:hypothetical protein